MTITLLVVRIFGSFTFSVCLHYTGNSFLCRHENVSGTVWTATVYNWKKSFTHTDHRTRGISRLRPVWCANITAPCPEYLLSCQWVPAHAPTCWQCDEEYDPILDDPLSTSVAPSAASLFNRNLREITILKSGSHMPPMYLWSSRWYHLGYFSDEWEHSLPATRAIAELYRRHAYEAELESTLQLRLG